MDPMSLASREYEAIAAKLRVLKALQVFPPNEAGSLFMPGYEVLLYRKNTGWDDPHILVCHVVGAKDALAL